MKTEEAEREYARRSKDIESLMENNDTGLYALIADANKILDEGEAYRKKAYDGSKEIPSNTIELRNKTIAMKERLDDVDITICSRIGGNYRNPNPVPVPSAKARYELNQAIGGLSDLLHAIGLISRR